MKDNINSRTVIFVNKQLRTPSPPSPEVAIIDGIENFFHLSAHPGLKPIKFDKGIWPVANVTAKGVQRRPLIVISSSPHKAGREETPWQDLFDLENGRIRYFGDNKTPGKSPENSQGNRALLEQFSLQSSNSKDQRRLAAPLLIFRRLKKGFITFQGFGIIERVERVTQVQSESSLPFTNYVFDMAILSQQAENEAFCWSWINDRRNAGLSVEETEREAPHSWREWLKGGSASLPLYRSAVANRGLIDPVDQSPKPGTAELQLLNKVYEYYGKKKHRFECLAEVVTERILSRGSAQYFPGWITSRGGDGGIDFIGRLDIGDGFSATKLVVIGQAKCEKIDKPTSGTHIARTVARLRRGYIGVYVTTSYFSKPVQQEVIQDKYPIVLVNGLRVSQEIKAMMIENGETNATEFLESLDNRYESRLSSANPEEILSR